ncbi:MAG: hypothetical protein ACE5FT_04985, partial [Candidatus Nanoarchaeia archaeon]
MTSTARSQRLFSLFVIMLFMLSPVEVIAVEPSDENFDANNPDTWDYGGTKVYTQVDPDDSNFKWGLADYNKVQWDKVDDYSKVEMKDVPEASYDDVQWKNVDNYDGVKMNKIPDEDYKDVKWGKVPTNSYPDVKWDKVPTAAYEFITWDKVSKEGVQQIAGDNLDKLITEFKKTKNIEHLKKLSGKQMAKQERLNQIDNLNQLGEGVAQAALIIIHSSLAGVSIDISKGFVTYKNGNLINKNIPGGINLNTITDAVASITATTEPPATNGFCIILRDGQGTCIAATPDSMVDKPITLTSEGTTMIPTATGPGFELKEGDMVAIVDAAGNINWVSRKGTSITINDISFEATGRPGQPTQFRFTEDGVAMNGPGRITSPNVNGKVQNGGSAIITFGATPQDLTVSARNAKLTVFKDEYSGDFDASYKDGKVEKYTIMTIGSWSEIDGFKDDKGLQIRDTLKGPGPYTVHVQAQQSGLGLEAHKLLAQREKLLIDQNRIKDLRAKIQAAPPGEKDRLTKEFLKTYNEGIPKARQGIEKSIANIEAALANLGTTAEEKAYYTAALQNWQTELSRLQTFTSISEVEKYTKESIGTFKDRLAEFAGNYPNTGWKSRDDGQILNRGLVRTGNSRNTFELEGQHDSSYTLYRPPEGDKKAIMYLDSHLSDVNIGRGEIRYTKEGASERSSLQFSVSKDAGKSRMRVTTGGLLLRGVTKLSGIPNVRLAIDGEVPGINYLDITRDSIIAAEQLTETQTENPTSFTSGEALTERVEQFKQYRSAVKGYLQVAASALARQAKEKQQAVNARTSELMEDEQEALTDADKRKIVKECGQDRNCQSAVVAKIINPRVIEKLAKEYRVDATGDIDAVMRRAMAKEAEPITALQKELAEEYAAPEAREELFEAELEAAAAARLKQVVQESYATATYQEKAGYDTLLNAATLKAIGKEYEAIDKFREAANIGSEQQQQDALSA